MRAASWNANRRLDFVDLPEPAPAPGEALVRVAACGICGTDLHLYRGELTPAAGSVPGHEFAGTLAAPANGLAAGTAVAVEPVVGCGGCGPCRGGNPHRCPSLRLVGISAPGALSELVTVPEANVYALPPGVDPGAGAFAEPLAVCVRAMRLAEPSLGGRAIILGAGAIGLATLLLLRRTATEIAVTARYPQQRALALRFGATAMFEPGSKDLRAWAKVHQPDLVVETVGGAADTLTEAIFNVRAGGTVLALGVFTGRPTIPGFRLVNDEVRLIGSVMYGRSEAGSDFGAAVSLLPSYVEEVALMQTLSFPLAQANEAFEAALDKSHGAVKVSVIPSA